MATLSGADVWDGGCASCLVQDRSRGDDRVLRVVEQSVATGQRALREDLGMWYEEVGQRWV